SFLKIQASHAQLTEPVPSAPLENSIKAHSEKIIIHISGAVLAPGLYQLTDCSRLYEAVEDAHGFAASADIDQNNLAQVINDGEKIIIPAKANPLIVSLTSATGNYPVSTLSKINLNQCSAKDLQTLSGIGSVTAKKI